VDLVPDKGKIKRWLGVPVLHDLDARLAMMREFGDEYRQILSLSLPAIEAVAGPDLGPDMARLANDSMAEIVGRHPERFPAFVASVAMNDVPAAIAEIRRTIEHLNAVGIQIYTSVNGRPLDDPAFEPIFAAMAAYDLPIWLHPARGPAPGDYATEPTSRFEIWWTFGWPYETSAAMARMVFSKFFLRWPGLKVICHHMGGMIPFFAGRVGHGWDQLGTRTADHDFAPLLAELGRPVDHFRRFIGDTALSGSRAGIECGLSFFGIDQVVFGTDFPFDPQGGPLFVRESIAAIDALGISEGDRRKIYEDTIRRLVGGRLPP
ncbi:MAG: amidohydrolase, partial [Planctomycetia bacterium]|nr:amidohydrolase [Planctomycetia bacterium]